MGHAAVSKPSNPQLGQVELGVEALQILNSLEEYSSPVTLMLSSHSPSQSTQGNSSVRKRVLKRRYFTWEGKEDEEDAEDESLTPTSLSPLPQKKFEADEQQLADVLYSALHLHSTRDPLLQQVAKKPAAGTGDEDPSVEGPTMDELRKELMDIFKVEEATMAVIEEQVQTRDPPRVTLHVNIHEAKDLKARTPRETSHPYCLVRVSGSTETFKTQVITDTLTPGWESQFSLFIPSRQDAKMTLEVWHDAEEARVEQLMNLKDIRELGRLVRDAASNLQSKEMRNLLGSVTVPLTEIKGQSVEGWHSLTKSREECSQVSLRESFRASKKRGSVRLTLRVSTIAQLNLIGPHWYDGFLSRAIQHHLGYLSSFGNFRRSKSRRSERSVFNLRGSRRSTKNNSVISKSWKGGSDSSQGDCPLGSSHTSGGSIFENEGLLSCSPPWNGTLSNTKLCLLEHYATTLNLTPPVTAFSWWKVCSRICIIDRAFLGTRLKIIQDHLSEGRYSCAEIEEIKGSMKLWVQAEIDALRNLTTYFPASTKVVSYAQLQGIVRNFNAVESNDITRQFHVFPSESPISQLISDSLMEFSKAWWESCLKNKGRNAHDVTEEQQLVFTVSVAGEVYAFLADVCNFYHDVFYREANISFLKLTYILLTVELCARVRPLLHQIYKSSTRRKISYDFKYSETDRYSLECGTSVWQLYKKCEIIEKIGENLPDEIQQQSGLKNYHHWFIGGIERWTERLFARTKAVMAKDVDKDDLEVYSSGVSTSAVEAKSNFKIIKSSWQKLAWPEEVAVDRVVKPLLHNLCGLGTYYVRLMIEKLETVQMAETTRDTGFLSTQRCTGLNNIQYLRKEVEAVPEFFELSDSDEGSEYFPVVTKTSSEMEESLSCFMDNVIAKLRPSLYIAATVSCDSGNEYHLLHEVLEKEFCVLRQRLDDTNFETFMLKIWKALVATFSKIVEMNAIRHNAEYFKGVFRVLERCWYFLTPSDGSGLQPQEAYTTEYQALLKTLHNLKLPTDSLIAKYYSERHNELLQAQSCVAELVVRAFFMKCGKLVTEIIMVKNNISSSRKPPNTQVEVRLVPSNWFRGNLNAKTKIHRKNETPVFEEKFEVTIYPTDPGLRNGFLLFLLKFHHMLQSEVIGEAVLPLEEIPSVDTPKATDIQNKYLNMDMPKSKNDYAAAKALQFRTWDRRAQLFLHRMSLRN